MAILSNIIYPVYLGISSNSPSQKPINIASADKESKPEIKHRRLTRENDPCANWTGWEICFDKRLKEGKYKDFGIETFAQYKEKREEYQGLENLAKLIGISVKELQSLKELSLDFGAGEIFEGDLAALKYFEHLDTLTLLNYDYDRDRLSASKYLKDITNLRKLIIWELEVPILGENHIWYYFKRSLPNCEIILHRMSELEQQQPAPKGNVEKPELPF